MEDYKEKLELARDWYNDQSTTKKEKVLLENLFPELKESEDERIKKEIIQFLQLPHPQFVGKRNYEKWITWLEKQDPKKHEEELENAYKCADEVQYRRGYEDAKRELKKQGEQPNKVSIWKHWKDGIAGNGEGKLIYLVKSGNTYMISSCLGFECDYIELSELDKLYVEKQGEQKPINSQFTPEQSSVLDKHIDKFLEQKSAWSEEDEEMTKCVLISLEFFENLGKDVTGHPHPNYFKVKHKIYPNSVRNWLKSLKERVQAQLKQEWTGYDEKAYEIALLDIDKSPSITKNDTIDWLKSLKNRVQPQSKQEWSEEDENMLQKAISTIMYALSIPIGKENDPCFVGSSTIAWLKSLKERIKEE